MAVHTASEIVGREVRIAVAGRLLIGLLDVPREARGMVVFAHGSGSGRHSPRNQFVAQTLVKNGLGTLLIDLLEEQEAEDRRNVFDIRLLAERLEGAAEWLKRQAETRRLVLGYFGASTGAGAALVAAARSPELVGAVVSRGGRPDLAREQLPHVLAPTLLIVGGYDEEVLELNRAAYAMLRCERELVVVPRATHLFPEPGALEEVARLATDWFLKHLAAPSPAPGQASRAGSGDAEQAGARVPREDMDLQC